MSKETEELEEEKDLNDEEYEKMKEELKEELREELKQDKKECKRHPNYVAFLIILLFAFFFTLGFAVGNKAVMPKLNSKEKQSENKKETPEKEKEDIKSLTESDIQDYLPIIDYFNSSHGDKYPLEIKELSNQQILWYAIIFAKSGLKDSFSQVEVSNYVHYAFGVDFSYKDEDIPCFVGDGTFYRYENNTYTRVGVHGHGGNGSYRSKAYFINGEKNDTKGVMEIQMKVLYGDYCGDTCGPIMNFYKEASRTAKGLYSEDGEFGDSDFDVAYEKFKNELPVTSFVFHKDSSNQYFLNSISVK